MDRDDMLASVSPRAVVMVPGVAIVVQGSALERVALLVPRVVEVVDGHEQSSSVELVGPVAPGGMCSRSTSTARGPDS